MNSVCILVLLRHRDSSNAVTPEVLNVTKESSNSDFFLSPIARSYDNRNWEKVAGPYQETRLKFSCYTSLQRCRVVFSVKPLYNEGSFYLLSFENNKTFKEKLSRFFSQSTWGPTREMIDTWVFPENLFGMASYLKDQINMPITSLREEFRRGVDFSLLDSSIGNAAVTPKHPCKQESRWRDYAFTSSGDYGKSLTVENVNGGLLLSVNGMPRTIVQSFRSTDSILNGAGHYHLGKLLHHRYLLSLD